MDITPRDIDNKIKENARAEFLFIGDYAAAITIEGKAHSVYYKGRNIFLESVSGSGNCEYYCTCKKKKEAKEIAEALNAVAGVPRPLREVFAYVS